MTDELYKQIDEIIEELVKNEVVICTKNTSELYNEAIVFLKSREIIKQTNKPFKYESTSKVYEIRKLGIKKYLEQIEQVEKLETKIKELTVKNLELQNKQMKRSVYFSIIGFVGGAVVTNLEYILTFFEIII